jgi:TonB family protein
MSCEIPDRKALVLLIFADVLTKLVRTGAAPRASSSIGRRANSPPDIGAPSLRCSQTGALVRLSGWHSAVFAIAAVAYLPLCAAAQSGSEAAVWASIEGSGSADQLKAYLDQYPTGQHAPEARRRFSQSANAMLPPEVQSIQVRFPQEVRRLGHSVGPLRVVKLGISVQRDGRASGVTVVQSSGLDLYDKAAAQAARDATYLPAVDRGMTVDARMDYDVSFGLLCNRAAGSPPDCYKRRFPTACTATVCEKLRR